jgi:tetratricopeptide (TPR) repeat protein
MVDKQFDAYLELARQQITQNNPNLALDTLKEAAKLDPNHATVHQLTALAYYFYFQQTRKKQYYEAAKGSVETSLRLAPNRAHSFYIKSLIFQYSKWDEAKAKEAIAHALRLDPNNPNYLVQAGNLNRKRYIWDKDKSLEYYEKALKLAPADAHVLSNLANHYYSFNETSTAESYARDALKTDAQNTVALIVMGHVLYKQRKYEDAHEHAIMVLSQNPRNYDALKLICLLESRKNILIGSSYKLGLWIQKPIPAILFYVTCIMLHITTRAGLIPILYANIAGIALRRRIKKYLADTQLKKNF